MKNAQVQPYLFFQGRCEEALEFYRKALGAEIGMVMRFKESPDPAPPGMVPPGWGEKVMHASFRIGQNELMASDGCDSSPITGVAMALAVTSEGDADSAFNALSEGGEVLMPLTKTFWSPRFGMVKDKFGIQWMVNVVGQPG